MEPIAIIGAGMRLPGDVQDMAGLAELLFGKVDAVREVPAERWSLAEHYDADHAAPGKSRARHAGLLGRLDLFDAEFFGIAPREAERLDPIHRLVLETGWEAIENAGIDPLGLAGSATGVYMAMGPSDYGRAVMADRPGLDAYTATGTAYGTAVGRLSYFLDLIGPAIALDTGCSGALIAVHLAAQGLKLGECDLALAGGVNIVLSPDLGVVYSKARMLAADGRCRTFSADAQGFVRGEGCGVVAMRRLSDAIARGDRILGVIRGSATNQDGRSAGLTAPRQSSQEAVIAAALKAADVDPLSVSFVEAHGTGTALGDPIEVAAIGNALCQGRPAHTPLAIGSIKTNIGHLESGAGIAGLLKLLAAFSRDAIPPGLHFEQPNPLIDWDALPITVPTEAIPWPRGDAPRIAGVSSFGFGGSNVHMIVAEPPAVPVLDRTDDPCGPMILPIAAQTQTALLELARRYRDLLADPAPDTASLADICRSAALGRAQFAHRHAIVGGTKGEMVAALDAILADTTRDALAKAPTEVRFMLSRAGTDEASVAGLSAAVPGFADGLRSTRDEGVEIASAVPLALARLWLSWGVRPCQLAGESGAEALVARVIAAIPGTEAAASRDPSAAIVLQIGTATGPDAGRAVIGDVARLYRASVAIDWRAFHRGLAYRRAELPAYPFDRKRHWAPQVAAFAQPWSASATPSGARAPLVETLANAPVARRFDLAVERVRDVFTTVREGAAPLPLDTAWRDAGIDPLSAELHERLELAFGGRLPPTVLLNNRNVQELARALIARLPAPQANGPVGSAPAARAAIGDAALRDKLVARLKELR